MALVVGGIDPGKTGGWAIFEGGDLFAAGRMDKTPLPVLHKQLSRCEEIIIERAQAAPKQGISTVFEYGRNFGRVEAVAMLTDAEIYYAAPQWWKSKLNVPVDKKLAVNKALDWIFDLEKYVKLEGDHGIAEAALLCQILLNAKLFDELVANNEKRETKRKRPSYRL
jgi:crossover junction endodeoxyribonuclease RuvC